VYSRDNYVQEQVPEYRGMRVRYLASAGTKHLDFIAHSAASSVRVLRDSADIVHYHALGSGLVAPIPRYLSRSKIVLTVHGLDYARKKWTGPGRVALKLGEALSARVPHATIAVSRALADHYATKLKRRAYYIPNGMPRAVQMPLGEVGRRLGITEQRYFLFVGRLVPEKAPDLLLRAFARVRADVRLVIAGSSGFTAEYAESLRCAAATDRRVVMPGGVFGAELSALYSNASAFVLPSSLEGLPITLLEAIGHRAPVIVSDIAPHLEVVGEDGPGHRVVPQGDAGSLTAAMEAMLGRSSEERAAVETLARRLADRYSWEAVADATERVYLRVLARDLPAAQTWPETEPVITRSPAASMATFSVVTSEELAGTASRLL
jgi:glycosyltransferase involved in cell wall biosynthesis